MPYWMSKNHPLFYRERGAGRPLFILHGNTSSSAMHEGELEHFGGSFHAVAPDFLGCGQSERVAEWPANWWLHSAADVANLVRHLGGKRAILVGTSGGGVVALLAAIHHPDVVRAVIADSCVENWTPEDVRLLVYDRARMSIGQMAFWQQAHGDDWSEVVAADGAMVNHWLDTGISFYDGRLGEIRCPVLLTDSLADDMLPRVAEQVSKMASEIPGCRAYLARGAPPDDVEPR